MTRTRELTRAFAAASVVLLLVSGATAGVAVAHAPGATTPNDSSDDDLDPASENESTATDDRPWTEWETDRGIDTSRWDGPPTIGADDDGGFTEFMQLVRRALDRSDESDRDDETSTTTPTETPESTTTEEATTTSTPAPTTEPETGTPEPTTTAETTESPTPTATPTEVETSTPTAGPTPEPTTEQPTRTETPEPTTTETTTTETPEPTTTEPTQTPESDGFDRSQVESLVHEHVNEERESRGLEPLSFDVELRSIARAHSEDMAVRGYFSHTNPDGESATDRYDRAGYDCRAPTGEGSYLTGGENIAQTWYDTPVQTDDGVVRYTSEDALARGIVSQWMGSDGHRENILTADWNNEGIGIHVTENGKVYATQNFC